MNKHSPLPFYVATKPEMDVDEIVQTGARSFSMTGGYTGNDEYDREMGVFAIVNGEPETIAQPYNEADARYIVLACNHFEELKEVVEYFVQLIEDGIESNVIKTTSDGCFTQAKSLLSRIEEAEKENPHGKN